MLGCLEIGCSVVALCWDEHHRDHMQRSVLERAVESMVAGTTRVFKDEALQARSLELKLAPPPSKAAKKSKKGKTIQEEQAASEDEKDKNPKKDTKDRKEHKGKKDKNDDSDEETVGDSSSSSSSSETKSGGEAKPSRKKAKRNA